ncbi:MAG: aspartate kinase [Flavobacteriaceae bacterium]|nr:aspartate kinase [Flavobacteriaceae bacterium]
MKTISSVVEHYIKTKPFLLNSISQGIINLTSLARIMMPEIEKELGKDVKQGAVVMALKRLSEELDFRINHKISKVLKNIGEITVRSSLVDYAFVVSETLLENQARLISEVNKNKDLFYTSSRGVNESNIIVSSSISANVEEIFKNEKRTHRVDDLSSITVKLPQVNVTIPGVFYYIFQRLAWEGVIIHEVISTTNEFTVIVHDKQIDIAFKVIKDLKNTEDF